MKFGDLITNSFWLSVETVFSNIYPDQLDYLTQVASYRLLLKL